MEFLRKFYLFVIDTAQSILLIVAIFLVVYVFLFRPFQVSGSSMYPNFVDKEYVLTNIISLRFTKPNRGDVIVFKAQDNTEKDYIKRVIGLPDDVIEIDNGNVYVNGKTLNQEGYLDLLIKTQGGAYLKEGVPMKVPDNSYFVMGDNRAGSSDSREWGFVPFNEIIGIAILVYWPPEKAGIIKNPYD